MLNTDNKHVPDSELQVPRYNTVLLVIARSIAGEFEDFSGKIFEYSSKIYCIVQSQVRVHDSEFRRSTYQVHQRQHVVHSCPSSRDGEYDRQEIGDRLLQSGIGICHRHLKLCRP